ncbi:MAG: sigma 54-interacting transcriptional regulator [Candidatus Sulfotelmatobacter sp.]
MQEHEFERVGGTGSIRTDVRVLAATNRDLEAAIAAGMFRSDQRQRATIDKRRFLDKRPRYVGAVFRVFGILWLPGR